MPKPRSLRFGGPDERCWRWGECCGFRIVAIGRWYFYAPADDQARLRARLAATYSGLGAAPPPFAVQLHGPSIIIDAGRPENIRGLEKMGFRTQAELATFLAAKLTRGEAR